MRARAAAMAPRIVGRHPVQVFIGAVDNAAADPATGLPGGEIVPRCGNRGVSGAEGPVLEEHVLELRYHRAFDLKVQVRDPVSVRALVEIAVADVHSAGEADSMVHHQNFSMVAQVDVDCGRQQPRRQEARMADPSFPENSARPGPGVELTDSVDDHPHVHRALPGPIERIDEAVPGCVGLKEVALEQNALPRAVDGGEHGGVGLLAIEERNDPVAVEQRAPGHRLRHPGDVEELVLELGERHPGEGLRPIPDLVHVESRDPSGLELLRPGGDAVHSEEEVEDRSRQRKEQAHGDPAERRPRVPLGEQHVSRGAGGRDRGQHPDEQGDHARPPAAAGRSEWVRISNGDYIAESHFG